MGLERRISDISEGINPDAALSGTGCVECLGTGRWRLHLQRSAKCGHIGCCDTSPNQYVTAHFRETGHFIMTSFEPSEDWFWNNRTGKAFYGPKLGQRGRDHLSSLHRAGRAFPQIGKTISIDNELFCDRGPFAAAAYALRVAR
jgi:hypothetical protein